MLPAELEICTTESVDRMSDKQDVEGSSVRKLSGWKQGKDLESGLAIGDDTSDSINIPSSPNQANPTRLTSRNRGIPMFIRRSVAYTMTLVPIVAAFTSLYLTYMTLQLIYDIFQYGISFLLQREVLEKLGWMNVVAWGGMFLMSRWPRVHHGIADWAGIRDSIDTSSSGRITLIALDIVGLDRKKYEERDIEGKSGLGSLDEKTSCTSSSRM